MRDEFEKYKTDKVIKLSTVVNGKEISIEMPGYEAGLGDILRDYLHHERRPWWKRGYNHNVITSKYREILNQMVTHTFILQDGDHELKRGKK